MNITASFGYDYQRRRSAKTVSGSTTTYTYDGMNLVKGALSSSTAYNFFGSGIDEPLAVYRDGSLRYTAVLN